MKIGNGRVRTILIVALFGLSLVVGWVIIAGAADFHVRENIKPRHRYYTSQQYSDFLLLYVVLSTILLSGMLTIRFQTRHWRSVLTVLRGVTFGIFLTLWIEDDIRFGRPIAPEIFFTALILIFHLFIFSLLSKFIERLRRDKVASGFL